VEPKEHGEREWGKQSLVKTGNERPGFPLQKINLKEKHGANSITKYKKKTEEEKR